MARVVDSFPSIRVVCWKCTKKEQGLPYSFDIQSFIEEFGATRVKQHHQWVIIWLPHQVHMQLEGSDGTFIWGDVCEIVGGITPELCFRTHLVEETSPLQHKRLLPWSMEVVSI